MTIKESDILTEEEWKALLAVPDISKVSGLRNLCIIVLMLDAGLKVSEIVGKERKKNSDLMSNSIEGGIRLHNIDFDTGTVHISRKNKDTRLVTLNDQAKRIISQWLKVRPESDTDLLFTNLQGGKVTNRYVREFLEKYGKKAGIRKKVHPSMLRHTFAKDLYSQSKNLRIVQKTLGFSNLNQTLRYADKNE